MPVERRIPVKGQKKRRHARQPKKRRTTPAEPLRIGHVIELSKVDAQYMLSMDENGKVGKDRMLVRLCKLPANAFEDLHVKLRELEVKPKTLAKIRGGKWLVIAHMGGRYVLSLLDKNDTYSDNAPMALYDPSKRTKHKIIGLMGATWDKM